MSNFITAYGPLHEPNSNKYTMPLGMKIALIADFLGKTLRVCDAAPCPAASVASGS
jgi:hypothetical protein